MLLYAFPFILHTDALIFGGRLKRGETNANSQTMIKNPLVAMHDFLHARTGEKGIRQAGMMRVAYAILYLYDQAVLGWSLEMFVLPSSGIIPYNIAMQSSESYLDTEHTWTLLQLFPESDAFVWLVWLAGLVHGVLLLLGIAPRLQLVGIMVNLMSFHRKLGDF